MENAKENFNTIHYILLSIFYFKNNAIPHDYYMADNIILIEKVLYNFR